VEHLTAVVVRLISIATSHFTFSPTGIFTIKKFFFFKINMPASLFLSFHSSFKILS